MKFPARATVAVVTLGIGLTSGCGDVNAALEKLSQARQLSADLLVQFTKAADASNRSVMADTDEASTAFAREADDAKQAVHHDVDTLGPMLKDLGYSDETRILEQFTSRFAEYDVLDRRILDLAVENTNLKAQRLSFGPAQKAVDDLRAALDAIVASAPARETWHVQALAASALASVREIQVLQAPHIAEADDAAMTRMEKQMAAAETGVRTALTSLAAITDPGARPRLGAATTAFDRFTGVNAQILALSRRNTNVRSLALSLNQKPALTDSCETSLRDLRDALGKRGYGVARWK